MVKPTTRTLEYLDWFEVADYMLETMNIDMDEKIKEFLILWGWRNDSYTWCPPFESDYMYDLDPGLVSELAALYSEFPDENGLMFHVSW